VDALSPRGLVKAARSAVVIALVSLAPIVAVVSRTDAFPPFGFGDLQRVSLSNPNTQLPSGASEPAISGNGRFVAFTTGENSPADSDTNGSNDVYVRDTIAGTTTLISKFQNTTNGVAGDDSSQATLSNDGRWVAFKSQSKQWGGPPFTASGVFVVDRGAPALDGSFPGPPGAPGLVSVDTTGTSSLGSAADSPTISADGSQIAFHVGLDVVLRDRDRNHNGVIAENALDQTTIDFGVAGAVSSQPKISADGRHVVFIAEKPVSVPKIASPPVPALTIHVKPLLLLDPNVLPLGAPIALVYDRSVDGTPDLDAAGNTRQTVATSTAFNLTDGDGIPLAVPLEDSASVSPDISADGNVVVYSYSHPMKMPTPPGRLPNATFQIIAVHRDASGNPVNPVVVSANSGNPAQLDTLAGNGDSSLPVVSDDGRYVNFASSATNLGLSSPQGVNCAGTAAAANRCDIYAVDLAAADADRAPVLTSKSADSNAANGTVGDKRSYQVAISATGQFSAITSDATNFVPAGGDSNNLPDVFVREWLPRLFVTFSPQPFTDTPVGATSGPFTATVDTNQFGPWSAAQVTVAGANTSDFTVSPDSCSHQVFHIGQPCAVAVIFHPTGIGLRDALLDITQAGHKLPHNFGLIQGVSSLPPSPGVTERASLGPNGQIPDSSFGGEISANGRYVAFQTNASLDPRDNNGTSDIYVRDRLRATTSLVSIAPGAATVSADSSFSSSISGDGRYIAFGSFTVVGTDNSTVPPTPLKAASVLVLDRGPVDGNGDFTGTPVLHVVSAQLNRAECDPDISGDGSQVTYWTSTPDEPGQTVFCSENDVRRAFVVNEDSNGNGVPYEGPADTTTTELTQGGFSAPRIPRISADGNHVVFVADIPVDETEFPDTASVAWAYDRQITGSGAKDGAGNTRYVMITSSAFTPQVAGDNRSSPFENTITDTPVVNGDGAVITYDFRYSNSSAPGTPQVLNSPFANNTDEIVVVRRDAAGNIASTDVASEAGSGPPTFGDGDSTNPDISDDGRYVTFDTHARNLLPHDAADCEGPCSVVVVADIVAPNHAGAPRVIGPSADPNSPIGGMPESSQFDTSVSGDGRFITFTSVADDQLPFVPAPGGAFVTPDTNNREDVFLRELRPVDSAMPPSVDFGAVPVGSSSALSSVQFSTADFGPAPVLSVSLTGANPGDFNIVGTAGCQPSLPDVPAAPVAPVPNYGIIHLDTPCLVSLNFAPIAVGTRTAVLRVVTGTPFPATNPEGLPIPPGTPPSRITTDVPLTGGAGPPAFQVTPVPLDFGLQTLGQLTPDAPLTVTNAGGNPFAISSVTLTGANPADFTITSDLCSGAVVNPLATCVVRVAFHSTAPGDRSAFVQFVDTAGGSPHLAPLRGRTPTLIANPGVVAPGRTVDVIGMGWQPGQAVALTTVDTRDPTRVYPESRIAIADAAGNFRVVAVLFPKTSPGSRFVVGTSLAPTATARAPLLVAYATSKAPNFLTRG
jgi:hypothetical protein